MMKVFARFVFLFLLLFLLINFPVTVLMKSTLSDHPGHVLIFFLIIWLFAIYLLRTYSKISMKSDLPTADE